MRKPALCMCENESTDQRPVSGQPISTFGFAIDTTDHYTSVSKQFVWELVENSEGRVSQNTAYLIL